MARAVRERTPELAILKVLGFHDTAILVLVLAESALLIVSGGILGMLLANLPGVARGHNGQPLLSAELSQVISLKSRADGLDANAQFRDIGPAAWDVHRNVRITSGRKPQPGLREVVVGQRAVARFRALDVGRTLRLVNQNWTIVGHFASGDAHDSELWGDADTLAAAYQLPVFQSVWIPTEGKGGLRRLQAAVAADPRLKLDVVSTRQYYANQSQNMSTLIDLLGTVIGAIMAVGAMFGALNTMYAAVAARAREIATLRVIGFRSLPVVVAVMLETLLLALLGGLLAWLAFDDYSASMMGGNFSQVIFQFKVTPTLLWTGLKWALGIGLAGGLFPALRAARLPVSQALRTT